VGFVTNLSTFEPFQSSGFQIRYEGEVLKPSLSGQKIAPPVEK